MMIVIGKRAQIEVGVALAVVGIAVVTVAALRFDAFAKSDDHYKKEILPYLIEHSLDYTPQDKNELNDVFVHMSHISAFHPSGHRYSRSNDLVLCGSTGLGILALGSYICLHARRRL